MTRTIFLLSCCLVAQLLTVSAVPAIVSSSGKQIGECASSEDCEFGSCCVLGFTRFSIPWCQPLLSEGESCRPGNHGRGFNTTLWYPNGVNFDLTNFYYVMCPCAEGLSCDAKSGVCKRFAPVSNDVSLH